MNRRNFFKKSGITLGAVVVAPHLLVPTKEEKPKISYIDPPPTIRQYPYTFSEAFSPIEIMQIWKQQGVLVYKF